MAAIPRRAEFHDIIKDRYGNVLSGASVNIYDPGTTDAVSETVYADATGATTLSNPLTTDATGRIQIYLDRPQIVDLAVSKTNYTSFTLEDVSVLRAGTYAATFTVAANDANVASIATCDYPCDGTADEEDFQAAIDALP